jgi:hypothetical protein
MSTAVTAAVTADAFVALFVGHQLGDHVFQRDGDAAAKATPAAEMLASGAHPWTGWPAALRHVGTYSLAQVAALAVVCVVAPLGWYGVVAALAVSASTHAVIDRRWIVRLLVRLKGCQGWREGPYLIDQSLHHMALLVAAVVAGAAASAATAGVVAACAAAVAVAGLAVEKRLATAARAPAARGA